MDDVGKCRKADRISCLTPGLNLTHSPAVPVLDDLHLFQGDQSFCDVFIEIADGISVSC
jgi:hypothetical protein